MTPDRWTILLVEDEALIRLAVAEDLRGQGFQVIEAKDAADAITVLNATPISLLFTDVQMTGPTDGLALAAWAKDKRPEVLLAITSGDPMSLSRAREQFPTALILPKPVDGAVAAALFRRHLRQPPSRGQNGAV